MTSPSKIPARNERKLEAWPEIAKAVVLAGSQVMCPVMDLAAAVS
jgi:hypothetical protein